MKLDSKYFQRAAKYLAYFVVLFFVMVFIITICTGQKITHFARLFREGSLGTITILFIVCAAAYPFFGFKKGRLVLDGDFSTYHDVIIECLKNAGYRLTVDTAEQMTFRHKSAGIRFSRMWEDAITFEIKEGDPVVMVDGPVKDTQKLIRNIYYQYRMNGNPNSSQA